MGPLHPTPVRGKLRPSLRRWIAAFGWLAVVIATLAGDLAYGLPAAESNAAIRQAVETFIRQGLPAGTSVTIDVDGPAPELRFPRCDHLSVAHFGPASAVGAQTVEVRCSAPRVWSLYLPVRVAQEQGVIVAARALQAGHVLSADDLSTVRRDTARLPPGTLMQTQAAVGQVLRYGVAAGQPIQQSMLTGPQLVHYGQPVSLVVQGMGIRLVALGQAMADGRVGQSVLVRNIQSGRMVSGVVDAQGQVVIPLN